MCVQIGAGHWVKDFGITHGRRGIAGRCRGRKSSPEIHWRGVRGSTHHCLSVAAPLAALSGSDAACLETAVGQQELLRWGPAATQGKLHIRSKPEPDAFSTVKYTGMNEDFSKSCCHYRISFIGSMQLDLTCQWTRRVTTCRIFQQLNLLYSCQILIKAYLCMIRVQGSFKITWTEGLIIFARV